MASRDQTPTVSPREIGIDAVPTKGPENLRAKDVQAETTVVHPEKKRNAFGNTRYPEAPPVEVIEAVEFGHSGPFR